MPSAHLQPPRALKSHIIKPPDDKPSMRLCLSDDTNNVFFFNLSQLKFFGNTKTSDLQGRTSVTGLSLSDELLQFASHADTECHNVGLTFVTLSIKLS